MLLLLSHLPPTWKSRWPWPSPQEFQNKKYRVYVELPFELIWTNEEENANHKLELRQGIESKPITTTFFL